MNLEGKRAFEAAHREHMERPAYTELFRLVSEHASKHGVNCRIDALHFLTLNFEFMVAEPLGQQRSGTMAAILHGDIRKAIGSDLDSIFKSVRLGASGRKVDLKEDFDPSHEDFDASENDAVSSGKMLEIVGKKYRQLKISEWRLWG